MAMKSNFYTNKVYELDFFYSLENYIPIKFVDNLKKVD